MVSKTEEGISRLVAMAWGVAAAPQRGPKRELSHERIVEAAIQIADSEGLAAVTMQRVARAFDFTTMALYRYVSSKDDLQRLMLDAAVGGAGWAIDDEDWRVGLEQWVRTVMEAYGRHPWALGIPLASETMLMPGQVSAVDAGMRAMRTLPGPAGDKLGVLMLLAVHARGFAVVERELISGDGDGDLSTRQLLRDIVAEGRFPDARDVIDSGVYFGDAEVGPDAAGADDVEFALSLLMPGIERAFATDGAEGVEGVETESSSSADSTPAAALASAEAELVSTIALRKATQRRASELEKREGRVRASRDRAKVLAKAASKEAARSVKGDTA